MSPYQIRIGELGRVDCAVNTSIAVDSRGDQGLFLPCAVRA
jgi:hypothetical protein